MPFRLDRVMRYGWEGTLRSPRVTAKKGKGRRERWFGGLCEDDRHSTSISIRQWSLEPHSFGSFRGFGTDTTMESPRSEHVIELILSFFRPFCVGGIVGGDVPGIFG